MIHKGEIKQLENGNFIQIEFSSIPREIFTEIAKIIKLCGGLYIPEMKKWFINEEDWYELEYKTAPLNK